MIEDGGPRARLLRAALAVKRRATDQQNPVVRVPLAATRSRTGLAGRRGASGCPVRSAPCLQPPALSSPVLAIDTSAQRLPLSPL